MRITSLQFLSMARLCILPKDDISKPIEVDGADFTGLVEFPSELSFFKSYSEQSQWWVVPLQTSSTSYLKVDKGFPKLKLIKANAGMKSSFMLHFEYDPYMKSFRKVSLVYNDISYDIKKTVSVEDVQYLTEASQKDTWLFIAKHSPVSNKAKREMLAKACDKFGINYSAIKSDLPK